MGILSSLFGNSQDTGQLGLLNTNIPVSASARADVKKTITTNANQYTTTDNRQYAPVDARQFSFVYNSPNARVDQSSDASGAISRPSVIPTISAPFEEAPTTGIDASLLGNTSSILLPLLLFGGGGFLIYKAATGGEKKK